jgi:hypothetical protein
MRPGLEHARGAGRESAQGPSRESGRDFGYPDLDRPQQDLDRQTRVHQELIAALVGRDAQGSQRVAELTRRTVRMAAMARREEQAGKRRTLGIAMAVCLGILTLLAPALWSSVDDLVAGEHFGDIPTQVALMVMILFPAVIAALIAGWQTRRGMENGHRSL